MKTHLGKIVGVPSVGETRFGSIDTMLVSCLQLKSAFVEYSRYRLKDDSFDCDLPTDLDQCVNSRRFWYSIAASIRFVHPVVWIIHYLEGDTVPCSATVACFLFLKQHIQNFALSPTNAGFREALGFNRLELERLLECIDRRWMRIRHPVLYLAFMLDPLFLHLRKDGVSHLGGENIQLESMKALQWLIRLRHDSLAGSMSPQDLQKRSSSILKQYSDWLISGPRNQFVIENATLHPKDFWGLMSSSWPNLALDVALPLSCFPATPCGGERNFKTMSRIDSNARVRLGNVKSDKQVACVYNESKLKSRELPSRDSDFNIMLQSISGALSSMNESELNRYEQIMCQESEAFAVDAAMAPNNDLVMISMSSGIDNPDDTSDDTDSDIGLVEDDDN